jgi:hypothetical protein
VIELADEDAKGSVILDVKETDIGTDLDEKRAAENVRIPPETRHNSQKPIKVDGNRGKEEGEKPVSRAERRRRIKEEIKRLSQGETPLYYQRRLY